MPDPTPYTPGGLDVAAGTALSVQVPPRVFLGRMTGLLFDTNKTFLLPHSLGGIRGLRRFFDGHPGMQVLVVGHTDTVGAPESNVTLSNERAHSISAYLQDDVEAWMEYYPGRPGSAHWGVTEDQLMLSELRDGSAPFYAGPNNGVLDTATRDAVKRFQQSKGLAADGTPGQNTRRALVTAYMQIPDTTLPPGTVVQTHGCGESHLAVLTGDEVAEPANRRVEVFFFENRVDPPPRARCPTPAGCPEYPEWLRRIVQTFDLAHPPGALEVRVIDPQGNPVAAAAVHASGPTVADKQSDAAGQAQFEDLIPGGYTLLAQKQGFRDGTTQVPVLPGAALDGPPAAPASAVVQLQAATGDLRVNVKDPAGNDLQGARVIVQDSSGSAVGNALTAADGSITFPGLAAGSYSVGVSATGFTGQSVAAQVLPGQINPVQVTLAVATGNLTVRVVDNLGGPLAGASVSVTPATGAAPPAQNTNAQGVATFANLEVGTAQISVLLSGFSTGAGSAIIVATSTATATITLTATTSTLDVHVTNSAGGGDLAGAQVALTGPSGSFTANTAAGGIASFTALPAGSYTAAVTLLDFAPGSGTTNVRINQNNLLTVALTASVGSLEIHVRDNLSAAVPGATVTLTPPSLSPPPSLDTDSQGRIGFTRVPVGSVAIVVRKTGFVDGTGTATVTPGGSTIATITLQPATVQLVVRVVSSAGGNLAGAQVSVTGAAASVSAPTGADGSARFELPVSTFDVSASLDNFTAPPPQSVTLTTAGSNGVTLTLTPNPVTATLSGLPLVAVLKKHNCTPARKPVRLGVTGAFTGSGSGRFTRSAAGVKFFNAAGTEITFNGTDNVFTAAQLTAGVPLSAEGAAVSGAQQDIDLRLDLFAGTNAFGTPAAGKATCVELTLDLFQSRTAAAGDPAPMGANAKTDTGRFIHVQDGGFHQGRALAVVREVRPAGFTGSLSVRLVPGGAGAGVLRLFAAEAPAAGQPVTALPLALTPAQLAGPAVAGAPGFALFVEGATVSGGLHDVGLQLGLDGDEPDGDRALFTVVALSNLTATLPSTTSPRTGAVPAHVPFTVAGTSGDDFNEDFAVNLPLVLLENCVNAAGPIRLAVTVLPAGVPISWSALRDVRPSPGGDDPSVIALSGNPQPSVSGAGATATLLSDAVGSFHLRAFVNNNATADFDRAGAGAAEFSPDPFLLLNLVLVRVTVETDDVQTHVGPGIVFGTGASAGTVRGNGPFTVNAPNGDGIHLNALLRMVSGGRGADVGRLGLPRVFGGWINNMTTDLDWSAQYLDSTVAPPAPHRTEMHFDTPPPALRTPPQPPVVPLAVPPQILDTGHDLGGDGIAGGTGGESACLRSNTLRAPTNLAVGLTLRIEAVDSPAPGFTLAHQGTAAAVLQSVHDALNFKAYLCLWTSNGITNRSPQTAPSRMPINAPGERLYTCALEVPWTSRGDFAINLAAAPPTITPTGAAPATNSGPNVLHNPAVAAGTTTVDVRPPAALRIIVTDAR